MKQCSYINTYKASLIEYLRHSDKRITEIALELGFTDESHLNIFFKKAKRHKPESFSAFVELKYYRLLY